MEIVQLIREAVSSFLFKVGMGQAYYIESELIYVLIAIILFVGIIFFSNKVGIKFPQGTPQVTLLIGLVVLFAAIRYQPFGGDAQIYCNYVYMDLFGNNIYESTEKYAFNYPPVFLGIIGQFCKFNYEINYPILYTILICAIGFFYSREYKIGLSTTMVLLTSSFLGLRWIFKTGNFLIWELIFLSLALYFSKKNENITLVLLVLLGLQRLWLLTAVIFWYIIAKEKIDYKGLVGSFSALSILALIRFDLLYSYLFQLYEGNTLSSVWNGNANHNSPSLFLNIVDVFNLHNNFKISLLLYCLTVLFFIYKNLVNNIFSNKAHILSQTIFLLIVLNPTFKPYLALLATVALFPLFEIMKKIALNHFFVLYCLLTNLFWIIGSIFPMGYPYSVFQIVFLLSAIKVINNTNYYIFDD